MRKTIYYTNNPKIVGIAFIIFSVIFGIIGILVMMLPKFKSQKCTETVFAEVVENLTEHDRHSHTGSSVLYRPVFAFTYKGENYHIESNTSANPPAFDIGEKVKLKIDPDDPSNIYAPADRTYGFIGIIFLFISGIFLIIGILLVISYIRSLKKEKTKMFYE